MALRTKHIVLASLALLVLVGVAFALPVFLPEKETRVDEDLSMLGDPDSIMTLASGTFQDGDAAHNVDGMVKILKASDGYYLRFIDYEQTQGPDVFVYLTKEAQWNKDSVESGLRVLIDGGADGGESTKTGTFSQKLPDDFDPAMYQGVAIWCDQFNVLFGSAELTAM